MTQSSMVTCFPFIAGGSIQSPMARGKPPCIEIEQGVFLLYWLIAIGCTSLADSRTEA